ncbi:MAG TPA: M20/M25/M40 family metallo-hydrolase [Planctomycetota bacterium]
MTSPGEESPARRAGSATLAVLLAGLALALLGRARPPALPATAPEPLFSAGRALEVLGRIARAPHPVGSGELDCVRLELLAELRALGLAPWEQEGRVDGVPLTNLLARLPGHASTGTILCLAHYDSVPSGPGAGDDGAGIVAWLEALRALRARGGQPRNDVLVLFTDGEELGLLGARLFAAQEGALDELAAVINLEAIGNGGPAVLFELGPASGRRVREYARAVPAPAATSLSDAIYARMPNDTDLTVFLRRGVPGFNLALTAGNAAYHAPHDTPANLDPQSLQHMGESALALLAHLAELDLSAGLEAPDASFHDLLGRALLVWPRALDVLAVALALVLAGAVWQRARRPWLELPGACARHALGSACWALAALAVYLTLDGLARLLTPRLDWVAGNTTSGMLLFAALALGLASAAARRSPQAGIEQGALAAWSLAALAALLVSPGASYVLAWPALAAGATALARRRAGWLALGFTLALGLPLLHTLFQLFLRRPPVALLLVGLVLASGARLFAPELRQLGHGHARRLATLSAVALGLALVVARGLVWRQGAPW